ncbi:hypothetical protein TraAM80_04376 [Trypanosoma rangeli]|uniref:EF-hand domain-containing protein n=1 Tax=Trypanosoma rangeli TaxID=5698 RepID=A0A3R7NFF7_TRYRA|nr:uncharacterized protein TraAM80_04376 [Trypanosoma rangeli]RNF05752.1 hypothetical protein TraAM80_04376 [Trypanosoma rangeli]|eukprot:RNF05752.1 hypothetical protein TraAM80_04376 [Trypanosoma rangeli]
MLPVRAGVATVACAASSITSQNKLSKELQTLSVKPRAGGGGNSSNSRTGNASGNPPTKHVVGHHAARGTDRTVVNVSARKGTGAAGCQTFDGDETLMEAVHRVRGVLQKYQGTPTAAAASQPSHSASSIPVSDQQEGEFENCEEILAATAVLLEKDAMFGPRLLSLLSGDALRALLIIGTTQEYFGQDAVEAQLRAVDKDQDDNISSQEYYAWVNTAVLERAAKRFDTPPTVMKVQDTTTSTSSTAAPATIATTKAVTVPAAGYISWGLWHRIALSAAVPFVAFGMLDNTILVTVGDTIDKRCAEAFGLSTMAAAALGGVVSGTAGIQMHGLAERMSQRLGLARPPTLTPPQRASTSTGNATGVGSTIGMMVGLLLGMTPLLLLSSSAS